MLRDSSLPICRLRWPSSSTSSHTTDKSRQTPDNCDRLVAFETDYPVINHVYVLRMLCRECARAVLHVRLVVMIAAIPSRNRGRSSTHRIANTRGIVHCCCPLRAFSPSASSCFPTGSDTRQGGTKSFELLCFARAGHGTVQRIARKPAIPTDISFPILGRTSTDSVPTL